MPHCTLVGLQLGRTAAVHFIGAREFSVPSQPMPRLRLLWWLGVTVLVQLGICW